MPYFGQGRRVGWPEITVTPADGRRPDPPDRADPHPPLPQPATGEPLGGHSIDFREVPDGGGFYWSAFVSRAKKPLLETFGQDLELYLKVAQSLGGEPQDLGDAAARFMAFPLVPVTHVLWRGDEEFPPEGNILFDATISQHLSTEDIAALAGASVYRLMAVAYKLRQGK